jgi:hypothetical protein
MAISDEHRKIIIDEVKFAVRKMEEVKDQTEKLYYFSAVFGVLHRIFNIEYDPELVFAHFILRSTHDAFNARLKAISAAGDSTVSISAKQFKKLSSLSKQFAIKYGKKQEIDSVLKSFAVLLYSTTGNGFYLMQKGALKI